MNSKSTKELAEIAVEKQIAKRDDKIDLSLARNILALQQAHSHIDDPEKRKPVIAEMNNLIDDHLRRSRGGVDRK